MKSSNNLLAFLRNSLITMTAGAFVPAICAAAQTSPVAVAAVLDYMSRSAKGSNAVLCLSIRLDRFDEVLSWRRDPRSTVVHASECTQEPDEVLHGKDRQPAVRIRFADFQVRADGTATLVMNSWCGSLCGGQWKYRLAGSDEDGWWVKSQELIVIY